MSFTLSVGQFNIFLRSYWSVFYCYWLELLISYIILTSKNWQSSKFTCRKFILLTFDKKVPQNKAFCIYFFNGYIFLSLPFDFPETSLKSEIFWYLTSYANFFVWQNRSSWIVAQDALNRRIPESSIYQEWTESMKLTLCICVEIHRIQKMIVLDMGCLGMPKVSQNNKSEKCSKWV